MKKLLALLVIVGFVGMFAAAFAYRKNRRLLWVALAVSYAAIIVQSREAVHMGVQADQQGTAGGVNDWFGLAWSIVWLANLALIIALHIVLHVSRRKGDG